MARDKRDDKDRRSGKRRPRGLLNCRHMHALSNEDRVGVFAVLCDRVASPKEIADELGEGLSQVSYHVSVLRKCGLIELDHTVPRRGAVEHFYRAATPTLIPPDAWRNLPARVRKSISLRILQEFFDDACASAEAGLFDKRPGELGWTPLILDPPGLSALGRLSRDFLEAVFVLQAEASQRLARENGEATREASATVFLASFLSARSPDEGKKASAGKRR